MYEFGNGWIFGKIMQFAVVLQFFFKNVCQKKYGFITQGFFYKRPEFK